MDARAFERRRSVQSVPRVLVAEVLIEQISAVPSHDAAPSNGLTANAKNVRCQLQHAYPQMAETFMARNVREISIAMKLVGASSRLKCFEALAARLLAGISHIADSSRTPHDVCGETAIIAGTECSRVPR